MNPRRIIGSVLATALAATSLGVVATAAAPAQAADPVQTRIVSSSADRGVISSYSTPAKYGDSINVNVNVEGLVSGEWKQIYAGSVTVTEQLASGAAPTTVASNTSAYVYDNFTARGNATYTVTYAGGTSGSGSTAVSYAPTALTIAGPPVQRKLTTTTISGKRAGFKGKLSPAVKTKITVLKKHGKKFKKFKVLRSKKNGRFTVVLPAPRRGKFHWRIIFAGDSQFVASAIQGTTYKGF
jgi:hypothetical protein